MSRIATNGEKTKTHKQDKPRPKGLKQRVGKSALTGLSLLPAAAVAAIPAAEFFGVADATVVKAYSESEHNLVTDSHAANVVIDNGVAGAVALAEATAMGLAVAKTRRLKGAYKSMEDQNSEKRNSRSGATRFLYGIPALPFVGLQKVGEGMEWAGTKVSQRKSRLARGIGNVAVDLGNVTAVTSTGAVANETFNGEPPSTKRTIWLGALGSAAVLGLIEGARKINQEVPFLRAPMNAVAEGFDTLTNFNVTRPWQSPVSATAFLLVAGGLAYKGFDIARYHREQEEVSNQLPMLVEQPDASSQA